MIATISTLSHSRVQIVARETKGCTLSAAASNLENCSNDLAPNLFAFRISFQQGLIGAFECLPFGFGPERVKHELRGLPDVRLVHALKIRSQYILMAYIAFG